MNESQAKLLNWMRRAVIAEDRLHRLQLLVMAMADRIHAQSELLSAKARVNSSNVKVAENKISETS